MVIPMDATSFRLLRWHRLPSNPQFYRAGGGSRKAFTGALRGYEAGS
jgi:hypothetical protein